MAETIGRAYVKILADGSGFPESVRDEVRAAEPALKKEARRQGDAYAEEFGKRVSQADIGKGIRESLERSMARTDISRAYFGSRDWDRFLGRLKKEAGQAGILAGHELEVEFRHNIEGLADAIEDMGPRFDAASRRLTESVDSVGDSGERNIHVFTELREQVDDLVDSEDDLVDAHDDVEESNRRLGFSFDKTRISLLRFSGEMDKIGGSIARAFGKGSRNNFLNFFGSMIGNLTRLPGLLATATSNVLGLGQSLGATFTDAGGGFSGFLAMIGRIGPALGVAAIGITGFVFLLGTVTSAMLLAAGAAAALASSLTFALVGALAPVAALLGPLAIGGIAVAAAFIGMDKAAQEATKEALEPFKDLLEDIGEAARPGILDGITDAFTRLSEQQGPGHRSFNLLDRLVNMFEAAGVAVGNFIEGFAIGMRGAGLSEFLRVMRDEMPSIMDRLGRSFGNTFEGISGVIATLSQPGGPVDRMMDSWLDLSRAFADWSVSSEAERFFENAAESAGALFDFLGPVWDLTKQILDAGRGPGNELFQSMGEAVQGWVDAINRDPDILKDFFEDAQRMGEAIGRAVVAVGELIGALDTAATRDFAVGIVNGIASIIGGIASLIGWFTQLDGSIQSIIIQGGLILAAFKFGPLLGGLALVASAVANAESKFSILTGTIGGAVAGFAVGGPLGAALGLTAGLFGTLWRNGEKATEALHAAADGAADDVSDWENLAESLNQVTGGFTSMTRAAIVAKLQEDKAGDGVGSLADQFAELGISLADATDAMLGQPAAVAKVDGALAALDGTIADDVDRLAELDRGLANQMLLGEAASSSRIAALTAEREEVIRAIDSNRNLRQSMDAGREAIDREGESLRQTAAAAVNWRKELKGFPTAIITKFRNADIPKSRKEAKTLIDTYNLAPKQIRTLFETLGFEVSERQLKKLIEWSKELDKQKPTPKITADDREFTRRATAVRSGLEALDRFVAVTTINTDADQALNMTAQVRQHMEYLDGLTSTTYVETVNRGRVSGGNQEFASGGMFSGARSIIIGEAGTEAVVPMNRPLSMVDPAVRYLSAVAQGLAVPGGGRPTKVIDVGGLTVVSNSDDPHAVATEVINTLVATTY